MSIRSLSVCLMLLLVVATPFGAASGAESAVGDADQSPSRNMASEDVASPEDPEEEWERYMPTPLNQRALAREYISSRKGSVHPALSVRYSYTDNLFQEPEKEKDTVLIITPTLRLAYPAIGSESLQVASMSIAPGGLEMSRLTPALNLQYQAFLQYQANILRHHDFTDQDTDRHNLQGRINLASNGGLKLELVDVYDMNNEPYNSGVDNELDEYKSNLVSAQLVFDPKKKIWVRLNYNRFDISYDDRRNEFRDRGDNQFAGYLYFRVRPKTSLFFEFDYLEIDYDEQEVNNAKQYHYLAGIEWDVTTKTTGLFKLGYGQRNPEESGVDTQEDLLLEGQIDYLYSPKTSFYLRGTRKYNETDLDLAGYRLTNNAQFGINYKLARKVTTTCDLYYLNDKYLGTKVTADGKTEQRDDDLWGASLSLGWHPRRWVTLSVGVSYGERDSNFSSFDYEEKSAYIDISLVF